MSVLIAETIADMRQLSGLDDGTYALCKENDYLYKYNSESEAADDGDVTLRPVMTGAGRWVQCEIKPINSNLAKWKVYRALLTQSSTDAPVARVLNHDEEDYLGGVVWTRTDTGAYTGTLTAIKAGLTQVIFGQPDGIASEAQIACDATADGHIHIVTGSAGEAADGLLAGVPIEIRVRKQGSSPTLLTAETNEDGDQVILTFDKPMNDYIPDRSEFPFVLAGNSGDAIGAMTLGEDDTQLILSAGDGEDLGIVSTDVVTISSNPPAFAESKDFGVLGTFLSRPVTNNVPAA